MKPEFNYDPFLFRDIPINAKVKSLSDQSIKDINTYGIKTTGLSKPHMIGCLLEALDENPEGVKSQLLINQFGTIERTSSGTIRAGGYSDVFMSACFCAYARSKKAIDILPLLNHTTKELNDQYYNNIKSIASLMDLKQQVNKPNAQSTYIVGEDIEYVDPNDDISSFFPIFDS